jgi:ribosomal protein L10
MKREEKEKQIQELHEKFSSATVAIMAEYSGLNVEDLTDLRRLLRKADAEFRVVKNTMAVRAAEGTSAVEAKPAFQGPIAVAFGYADPVPPTKIMKEFADKKEMLKIKMGVIEGRIVDAKNIKFIAQLPSREVLIANLVSQLQAPITGVVWVLEGLMQQLVGTLDAIREKKGSEASPQ